MQEKTLVNRTIMGEID